MRIVLDATVLQIPFSGVAKATLALYQACLDLRPDLRVEAWHRCLFAGSLPPGMAHRQFGSLLPQRFWRHAALPMAAWRNRPPVMHFPWNGKLPRTGLPATRVVVTLHDVLPLVIPGFFAREKDERDYRQALQRDLDRTHLLITDSAYSRQSILQHFHVRSEPQVVLCAPTLPPSPEPARGEANPDYFLYFGGYDPRKGLVPLLAAFLELHRAGQLSSRLVLTGTRHYFSPEFEQLVQEGRERGIVEEKGYVSDEELSALLAGAKAMLYPSKYEGFGLPPMEALASGCPVLTAAATSLPEVCGDAALYVDPDDEASLSAGMLALEHQPELRLALRDRGRQRARQFSWPASAEKYLQAVERLAP